MSCCINKKYSRSHKHKKYNYTTDQKGIQGQVDKLEKLTDRIDRTKKKKRKKKKKKRKKKGGQ